MAQRLHTLRSLCQGPAGGGVRLRGRLGEGGMGEVLLAEQVSMERDVAVKRLKPEARNDYSTLKLLQEAWVTGYLEHPNVIPVYDITVDAQGSPLILLKRIHGVAWGELMDDPETVRRRWGAADLLEWNLRVLMQVCDAVQFAHARGIVHRDLKPENVMVGEHGEVYVVDWGIAVTLREELASRLPLANKASELAGTPCYMAPEMLGRPGDQLSPRTDVYLLGAMLYEIMLSARPHPGNSFAEILASVLASPPPIPDDAPQELTRICTQAMALHPHDRHASALDFKLALEGFVRHRGSRRLARRASRRLEQLYGELAQAEPGQRDPERHLRLHRLHAECRFAFREALKEWPENGAAQRGLRAATLSMVEYELDNHDARGAATMLGRISEPPRRWRNEWPRPSAATNTSGPAWPCSAVAACVRRCATRRAWRSRWGSAPGSRSCWPSWPALQGASVASPGSCPCWRARRSWRSWWSASCFARLRRAPHARPRPPTRARPCAFLLRRAVRSPCSATWGSMPWTAPMWSCGICAPAHAAPRPHRSSHRAELHRTCPAAPLSHRDGGWSTPTKVC
ncbi:MAG: serine/threonine protein kinase [Sandaracinaceae bacterium]|nr:serine/threonine protein kinase [Sandaracinaceae bacterium]